MSSDSAPHSAVEDISVRLVIRGPSPYFTDPAHVEEAEAFAATIRVDGYRAEVAIAPPEAGAPMASGVVEWLLVFVAGPAAGTITTRAINDLYERCSGWLSRRLSAPEQRGLRFGRLKIYGPDGKVLREWETTRSQESDDFPDDVRE